MVIEFVFDYKNIKSKEILFGNDKRRSYQGTLKLIIVSRRASSEGKTSSQREYTSNNPLRPTCVIKGFSTPIG